MILSDDVKTMTNFCSYIKMELTVKMVGERKKTMVFLDNVNRVFFPATPLAYIHQT